MTIAAGFVASDGLLLCADMLVSDSYTKQYRNKLFMWQGNDISVCMAIAGDATMAMMAAEHCSMALDALDWDGQSFSEVYGTLASVVRHVQHEYVDKCPAEDRERSRFYMLIGIWTENSGHRLYSTSNAAISPVTGYECIGSGRNVGIYIIEPSYDSYLSINQVSLIALYALAGAKERCDGVGGRSQFIALKRGVMSPIAEFEVGTHEADVIEYRQACYRLLADIHNRNVDEAAFQKSLQSFVDDAKFLKAKWAAPSEMYKEFEEWLARVAEQSRPQSTKADPLHQPPLQE